MLTGLFLGFLFFHSNEGTEAKAHIEDANQPAVWTCSMHPQIRKSEPGQCPICGMDLIPLQSLAANDNPNSVMLSKTAARLANIRTMAVGQGSAIKNIRLNGKVVPDERLVKTQSSHVSGRIEQLLVNTTGEQVSRGQKLAVIYSPELISAQQELLQGAAIKQSQPILYKAAREKLKALRVSENQINQIEESGEVQENMAIYADRGGIVLKKMVNVGDYLQKGEALFTMADLSDLWVVFDAYENDLPFLKRGDELRFSVASLPGKEFKGKITFINPTINAQTRVAEVRVETNNPGMELKPEMFATAEIEANIGGGNQMVIPRSAVMWTGERSVVYVKDTTASQPSYQLREVILGPALGDGYIIDSGLRPGEEVVVNGTFTVDAAAQLAGKPSMMNQESNNMPVEKEDMPANNEGTVSQSVKIQIQSLLQDYFAIKDALVSSDQKGAAVAALQLKKSLAEVDTKSMGPKKRQHWMKILPALEASLKEINIQSNIDSQRMAFIGLSQSIVELSKAFGPFDKPIYIIHCPMANEKKGADWLSASDKILNPYYGSMMLDCGAVKTTIQ